jgi:hypothetical protein
MGNAGQKANAEVDIEGVDCSESPDRNNSGSMVRVLLQLYHGFETDLLSVLLKNR